MQVSDLTGDAKAAYQTWLDLGLSEARALEEASAVQWEQQVDERMARIIAGNRNIPYEQALTEAQAGHRNQQRRRAADPFDERVATFRDLGLSEAAAKVAAIGRDGGTEREVRADLFETARASLPQADTTPHGHELALARATALYARYHGLTEAEARPKMIESVRLLEKQPGWTGDEFHAEVLTYIRVLESMNKAKDSKSA